MPDVLRPYVLPKGNYIMPHPTSSDHACIPREVISCHARRRSTVCAVQGRGFHVMADVVRLYVPTKGGDGFPRLTLPTLCVVQGR